jgi:FtsH-binding integral membrane protein
MGFMAIAVAVSLLVAWVQGDWWLFIPLMLILAGGFWAAIGLVMRPVEGARGSGLGVKSYYVFWGATLVLLGAIWFLSDMYPGNGPAMVALFLIWIGAMALGLSLVRMRRQGQKA